MTPRFLPRNLALKERSRELRTNATKQEQHLWYDFLRQMKPRFSRQRIIGEFIVDFYCFDAALVIELDGMQHSLPDAMEYDAERTAMLNGWGIRVLRFTNREVDNNFSDVCVKIVDAVQDRPSPPKAPFERSCQRADLAPPAD